MDALSATLRRAGFAVQAVAKPRGLEDVFGAGRHEDPARKIAKTDEGALAEAKRRPARARSTRAKRP